MDVNKRSLAFVLVLLATTVYGATNCDLKAPIPKQEPPIDIGEFKGYWYETVTTLDPISLGHDCRLIKDFTVTVNPEGYQASQSFYFHNAPVISFPIYCSKTEDGHFRQRIVERNETIGHEGNENGGINPKAAAEYSEIEWEEYALLGDPDLYLGFVKCSTTGWIVWILTHEKTISTELLVYVHNDLLKYGVSAPLRLGHCDTIVEK